MATRIATSLSNQGENVNIRAGMEVLTVARMEVTLDYISGWAMAMSLSALFVVHISLSLNTRDPLLVPRLRA
jgi:hypothetical protein